MYVCVGGTERLYVMSLSGLSSNSSHSGQRLSVNEWADVNKLEKTKIGSVPPLSVFINVQFTLGYIFKWP